MDIETLFQKASNPEKAKLLQRFFKTGKGDYGEGDIFLGITVPESRRIVRQLKDISFQKINKLLQSNIHEKRLVALLILVHNYKIADKNKNLKQKQIIYDYYLKNAKRINNWDLVDLSAPNIIGNYLMDKKEERKILYKLAKSENLWERRISILASFSFIKNNDFKDSLKLAEILLGDKHDLIHKAVGWMLREIGKRNKGVEENFLKKYYKIMPRTMLRYAIERFPEDERRKFLNGEI